MVDHPNQSHDRITRHMNHGIHLIMSKKTDAIALQDKHNYNC